MKCWIYRFAALFSGLLGVGLVALVCRAVFQTDHDSETLVFTLGLPFLLLFTVLGALLIASSSGFLATARRRRVERR
jgi:uncharacterized membrane protein YeiB